MKAKFEIINFLKENRNTVINSYNELVKEDLFNGISQNDFMRKILANFQMNNVKSEKRAASMLPNIIGECYYNNSCLGADVYSTSYKNSNSAKKVNYYGKEKANQLSNL